MEPFLCQLIGSRDCLEDLTQCRGYHSSLMLCSVFLLVKAEASSDSVTPSKLLRKEKLQRSGSFLSSALGKAEMASSYFTQLHLHCFNAKGTEGDDVFVLCKSIGTQQQPKPSINCSAKHSHETY